MTQTQIRRPATRPTQVPVDRRTPSGRTLPF
jgi:hypothetical protein